MGKKDDLLALSDRELLVEISDGVSDVGAQLRRLNRNLESGLVNIRAHHPLCIAPPNAELSISQMEAAGKFLAHAIETGALVLPPKGGGNVAAEKSGGDL